MARLSFTILALTLPLAVTAHHSRAPFLLDETMQIEGVVTMVDWGNPHLYLEITVLNDMGGEDLWTFEGHSVPGLVRLGWEEDTVETGDSIVIVANPNSDPETRFALLDSVTTSEGETFYAFRVPEDVAPPQPPQVVERSTDFSGTWRIVRTRREFQVGAAFDPPVGWPLTELGQEELDNYDPNDNPSFSCIPASVPRITLGAYGYLFERDENQIVITKEHSTQVRTIHMDGTEPPEDLEPGLLGYSMGHIEGSGALVIETTQFGRTRWGNARGIDSSDQKKVTERYLLADDGLGMDISYTIEDPVYLTEPMTVTGRYRKVADYDFPEEPPCDPETSSRHLEFE